jgi:hypothetical protein
MLSDHDERVILLSLIGDHASLLGHFDSLIEAINFPVPQLRELSANLMVAIT